MAGIVSDLGEEVLDALRPLTDGFASREGFVTLLAAHGWRLDPEAFDLETVAGLFGLDDAIAAIEAIVDQLGSTPPAELPNLLPQLLDQARAALDQLREQVQPDLSALPAPLNRADFWERFPADVANGLVAGYLERRWPVIYALFQLCGLITITPVPAADGDPDQLAFERRVVRWGHIPDLLRPAELFRDTYGWGTPTFDALTLLQRVARAFRALGLGVSLQRPPEATLNHYFAAANPLRDQVLELVAILGIPTAGGDPFRVAVMPIPADPNGAFVGLAITPLVGAPGPYQLPEPYVLTVSGAFAQDRAISVELRPNGMTLRQPGGGTPNAALHIGSRPSAATTLIGDPAGDSVQIGGWLAGITVGGSVAAPEIALGLSLERLDANLDLGVLFFRLLDLPLRIAARSLALSFGKQVRLQAEGLRLELELLGELKLLGDLDLRFADGVLADGSQLRLQEPEAFTLPLDLFELDAAHLRLSLQNSPVGRVIGALTGAPFERGGSASGALTLGLTFGQPLRELRLDWSLPQQSLGLPGLSVDLPDNLDLGLVLRDDDGGAFDRLALVAQLPANGAIVGRTTFAWGRPGGDGDERELQNDGKPRPEPLIAVTIRPDREVGLLIADIPLDGGLPTLFRQLSDGGGNTLSYGPLDGEVWSGELKLNVGENGFQLPFLEQSDAQFIQLDTSRLTNTALRFEPARTEMPVGIKLKLADELELSTEFQLVFDFERFALSVNHEQGIALYADEAVTRHFLGLDWSFDAPVLTDGPHAGKRHFFTLVTKNYDYQIQQAPGSVFRVSYNDISEEPLTFAIRDFVLRPKGLSLRATVEQAPVRLLGIDTKFRFDNSGFELRDSKLVAFTLSGSGALPPALVGDSSVDIFLNFGPNANGNITLLNGEANLRGNKLLQCKGTRFEFAITKLGIRFVNEGRFHLYFTVSGSAQFRLASSDEREGLLMLLPTIKIEMVDCPLAGDVRVLAKHVKFLVTLPRPLSFSLLGCFEMELRGFGFVPQAEMFGGDGAMWLAGQIKFAQGEGDARNDQTDFHSLFIGLPEPGSILPRIHLEQIVVDVKIGDAFRLYAMVKFVNNEREKGFLGEGSLSISGLPRLDAAFGFLRVREAEGKPWVRAWFIYAQAAELSLMIPIVQIYIREIGFGLGYRYTLAMIKAADEEGDARKLIKELDKLAASQGELARVSNWRVDIGGRGDPRWTIVLRAMISQNSASPPTRLARPAEQGLANTFLFDAVLAFRSDLTFLITARGWLNTNYVDYVDNAGGLRTRPFLVAYILLSVPQQRFLARISTVPNGYIGDHPPLPGFIKDAIAGIRFRATLLIEPGLFHLDLGWPNQLGWSATLGPFTVTIVGGFIFRITRDELVMGVSYMARGAVEIEGGVSIGIAGVNVYARAEVAYGMRYIGVLSLSDPTGKSLFYGATGLEVQIKFSIEFWLNLLFKKIRKKFSFAIAYSAALEFGLDGLDPGVRGTGSLALKVCGRSFRITISISVNEPAVEAALKRTEQYLKLGLDADDSGGPPEPVPGTTPLELAGAADPFAFAVRSVLGAAPVSRWPELVLGAAPEGLSAPHYSAFVQRKSDASHAGWSYLLLFPRSTPLPNVAGDQGMAYTGFLPVPPTGDADDFVLEGLAGDGFTVERYDAESATWVDPDEAGLFRWRARWDVPVALGLGDDPSASAEPTLRQLLEGTFVAGEGGPRDPESLDVLDRAELTDERVYSPSERDFEAAVRGAFTQFAGAPFFKHDPELAYDRQLDRAFSPTTSIYAAGGELQDQQLNSRDTAAGQSQHADQMRGMLVHDGIVAVQAYAASTQAAQRERFEGFAPAFQLGMVFRFKGTPPTWLVSGDAPTEAVERPTIRQRLGGDAPDDGPARELWAFNPPGTSFATFAPSFRRVRHYTSASTIGIAWELGWESPPPGCVDEQADPEQHLAHYSVLRRALDSGERDLVFSVKPAEVLNRTAADTLEVLRPRFQVVDHFGSETAAELAALPESGRSYLYTITPVDFGGNSGRPLSLIATRFPDRAPRVPTDARLSVRYSFAPRLDRAPLPSAAAPSLVEPDELRVSWTEQPAGRDELRVPVRGYRLIFRRATALPVGSYGLDNTTQRGAQTLVGGALARPLPTDQIVDLDPVTAQGEERSVIVPLAELEEAGIFPAGSRAWRPDSWEVFIQAIALNGVPSALAPVQLSLVVAHSGAGGRELLAERQPAELEWLPNPQTLPLLPPEDQRAQVGLAHFPMPVVAWNGTRYAAAFDGTLAPVKHLPHPDEIRSVRLRWNQGPSGVPGYPLELSAGYWLAELDIDAFTDATFVDRARLAAALRTIQEVRMVPAGDLPFLPRTTLAVSQWEAWYPSAMLRRIDLSDAAVRPLNDPLPQPLPGSTSPRSGWYSWRESLLAWPNPEIDDDQPWRSGPLHPMLQRLVDRLNGVIFRVDAESVPNTLEATLNSGQAPSAFPWAGHGIVLTAGARVRTVVSGMEWALDDDANSSVLFTYRLGGRKQQVLATRLRIRKVDLGYEVAAESPFVVDMQQVAVAQQGRFDDWLAATPPKADPYGWGVLQLLGLSVTFALRDARTARPVLGDDLLGAIHEALEALWPIGQILNPDGTVQRAGPFEQFRPHLFVEALFQPSRTIELDPVASDAGRLLANAQISLRPVLRQVRPYATLSLTPAVPSAAAGETPATTTTVELAFDLAEGQLCDVIVLEDSSGLQQRLVGQGDKPVRLAVTLRAGAPATLLIRGDALLNRVSGRPRELSVVSRLPAIGLTMPTPAALPALPAAVTDNFSITDEGGTLVVLPKPELRTRTQVDQDAALAAFHTAFAEVALPVAQLNLPAHLPPTDERAARFLAPADELAETIFAPSTQGSGVFLAPFWANFKRYVDAIYTSAATPIVAPAAPFAVKEIVASYLNWSQRFFDNAGAPTPPRALAAADTPPDPAAVAQYGAGPWLATAYPRAGTPAYATPDAAGRLGYDHLVPDRWAHTLRYFLQPYGRYERLVAALRAELEATRVAGLGEPAITPDPQAGGLDVVLDRTERLVAPLVLYSGRLDEAARPGQPVPPGSTWEVIVARHPEQTLSERNQLLRRRLAYRQIAFTLLRRLDDAAWLDELESLIGEATDASAELAVRSIAQVQQPIPTAYPPVPDQLDLPALRGEQTLLGPNELEAQAAARRSLDLPLRIARFQQGALVLQWEGLPFFYAHRLLLVAQADSKASPVTELTQRDFTYRSPHPAAEATGAIDDVFVGGPFAVDGRARGFNLRHYRLTVPLRRLWDSMPAEAQRRWPAEAPGQAPYDEDRPASALPDPEVVYQLTQRFSGNVEVQAELFTARPEAVDGTIQPRRYAGRQLAERVLAGEPRFVAPDGQSGNFALAVDLVVYSETPLSRVYPAAAGLGPVAFRPAPPAAPPAEGEAPQPGQLPVLLVAGPLGRELYRQLLDMVGGDTPDGAALTALFESWFVQEPVTAFRDFANIPADVPPPELRAAWEPLKSLVDGPRATELTLVWSGPISPAQQDALRALAGDSAFVAAAQRLAAAAKAAEDALLTTVPALAPPELWPAGAPAQLGRVREPGGTIVELSWSGAMSTDQAGALETLSDDPVLAEALVALGRAAHANSAALTARASAPKAPDQLNFTVVLPAQPAPAPVNALPFSRLQLAFDPATGRYTSLGVPGFLFDDARDAILAELARENPIAELREGVARLLDLLDGRVLEASGRVRPGQEQLPDELRTQLTIDELGAELRWTGVAPTGEQRQAASVLAADPPFVAAVLTLIDQLRQIDVQVTGGLPEGAEPVTVPVALAGRLQLTIAATGAVLRWAGPVPSPAEEVLIEGLWPGTPFATLIPDLLALIRALRRVALPPPPPPFQIPAPQVQAVGAQLTVGTAEGVTSFRWAGRVRSDAQATALAAILPLLQQSPYRALAPAFASILDILQGPTSVPLDLAARPAQAELPDTLRDQLLLGRGSLRYHGLMTADEGRALRWLYAQPAGEEPAPGATVDQGAVERLYRASLLRLKSFRELSVRSRRANAVPSPLVPLSITALEE